MQEVSETPIEIWIISEFKNWAEKFHQIFWLTVIKLSHLKSLFKSSGQDWSQWTRLISALLVWVCILDESKTAVSSKTPGQLCLLWCDVLQIPHHFASWASCLLQVRSLEGGKFCCTVRGQVWVALHRLAELLAEDHWAHALYHIWRLLERLILWLCHHLTIEGLDDIILIRTDQSWRVVVRTTFIGRASASIILIPVSWIDAVSLVTEASITELRATASRSSLALSLHLWVLIV